MPVVFAYGSNLDPVQMIARCPSARLLGEARLPGMQLAFVGHSRTRSGAVATVSACNGKFVPGLIWHVSYADLAVLDAYEGAPTVYYRRRRAVVLPAGNTAKAHVYRHRSPKLGLPHPDYFSIVARAYVSRDFPLAPLEAALRLSGVNLKARTAAPTLTTKGA